MSGTAWQDFSVNNSSTPIRARLFADGIWEDWSVDLFDESLTGTFEITTAAIADENDFAGALADYSIANGAGADILPVPIWGPRAVMRAVWPCSFCGSATCYGFCEDD